MKIESHNHLTSPLLLPSTRMVLRDDFNQPILLAIEIAPNSILVWKRTDPGFDQAMRQYGIAFTTVEDRQVDVRPGNIRIGG